MTSPSQRLNSWKEIAAHLGCDVSTAQRWERERDLPVRRIPGGHSVFAHPEELDAWLEAGKGSIAHPKETTIPSRPTLRRVIAVGVPATILAGILVFVMLRSTKSTPSANTLTGRLRIPASAAYLVKAADLNEDSIPDLVVSGPPTRIATVILLDGSGNARSAQGFETCDMQGPLAVADLDNDHHVDIVVACTNAQIEVFWGDGSATLKNPSRIPTPGGVTMVDTGDFNGDGIPDLVIGGLTRIAILESRGRHFFQIYEHQTGARVLQAALGDFNGDGAVDLALPMVGYGEQHLLLSFLNSGSGRMKALPVQSVDSTTGSIAMGDFNEDGKQDLVVGTFDGLALLSGMGDGTFRVPIGIKIEDGLRSSRNPITTDFDGDGHLDLAVTQGTAGNVHILYGSGNGQFVDRRTLIFDTQVIGITASDFNGDGKPDIAICMNFENAVAISLNPFRAANK